MEIKIEKNIIMPQYVNPKIQQLPVGEMIVGDCIFVPQHYVGKWQIKRYFGNINKAESSNARFKCTDDIVIGEKGVRIWRIK